MSNPAVVLGIAQCGLFDVVFDLRPGDWSYAIESEQSKDCFMSFLTYLFERWYIASDSIRQHLVRLDLSPFHPLEQPSKQNFAKNVFVDYFIRHTAAYQKTKSEFGITGYPTAPNPAFAQVMRFCIGYYETHRNISILDLK